ncbi:MAG: M50 family metallopeptidase [Anaerolineales bacterium]|jgi:regulator of sigma E protease|nr:M50 family metallopeptidase [Anaerolineales bacterium]
MSFIVFLVFFLALAGSIFIHELGHFIAARLAKIEVEEFGFGLPPKAMTLFKWQGTEFTLNWIPLGGFVRPKGENDPNVPDGLSAASPWKRLGVLLAGPAMNLLTAVLVFAIIVGLSGVAVPGNVRVVNVQPASPAFDSGLSAGDAILTLNGLPVADVTEAREKIRANIDQPITFLVDRKGEQMTLVATPLSSRTEDQGALGVGLDMPRRAATLGEAIQGGVVLTGTQAVLILSIPVMLIKGAIQPGEARLVGLVGMFGMFSQAVERDTTTRQEAAVASSAGEPAPLPSNYTLSLLAMLSVSLGVFNLLPIPALDGGRIFFTLPEILFRRRIPYKFENIVNGVAFLLLIGLMIFVNLMDVLNPSNFRLP